MQDCGRFNGKVLSSKYKVLSIRNLNAAIL